MVVHTTNTKNQSFSSIPAKNADINLLLTYVDLGFESGKMTLQSLWGFSPQRSWMKRGMAIPIGESGDILLAGEHEAGKSWRIDKEKPWKVFYDPRTEWVCIGDYSNDESDHNVLFMKSAIATIKKSGELKAIWVNPIFVESIANIE